MHYLNQRSSLSDKNLISVDSYANFRYHVNKEIVISKKTTILSGLIVSNATPVISLLKDKPFGSLPGVQSKATIRQICPKTQLSGQFECANAKHRRMKIEA
jgi:hypothetical protein